MDEESAPPRDTLPIEPKNSWSTLNTAFTPRRQHDPSVLAEAITQAMVAASSILAAGGSEAVAMSSAKAAAEAVLNSSESGRGFFTRRRNKQQAEVVGSMAFFSASNANSNNSFMQSWGLPSTIMRNESQSTTKTPSTLGHSIKTGVVGTIDKAFSSPKQRDQKDVANDVPETVKEEKTIKQDDEDDDALIESYWKKKQAEEDEKVQSPPASPKRIHFACIPTKHRSMDSDASSVMYTIESRDDTTQYTYDDATYDSGTYVNTVHINESACCHNPDKEDAFLNALSSVFCGLGAVSPRGKDPFKKTHQRMESDEVITGIYKQDERDDEESIDARVRTMDPIINDRSLVGATPKSTLSRKSMDTAEIKRILDDDDTTAASNNHSSSFWDTKQTRSSASRLLEQTVLEALSPRSLSQRDTDASFDEILDRASNPTSPNAHQYAYGSRFHVRGIHGRDSSHPEDSLRLTTPSKKKGLFGWRKKKSVQM